MLSLATSAVAGAGEVGREPTALVLPYVVVAGEVPPAEVFGLENALREAVRATHAVRDAVPDPAILRSLDELEAARRQVDEAIELLEEAAALAHAKPPRLKAAIAASEAGIEQFLEHFHGARDFQPLAEAWLQLAVAHLKVDHEKAATRELESLLRIDPERVPVLADAPPVFARLHEKARKAHAARGFGSLRVEVDAPGAHVTIDGRDRGPAPLTVPLVPGEHYVRVSAEGSGAWWAVVSIESGRGQVVAAKIGRVLTPPDLRDALARGTFDRPLVEALRAHATEAGAGLVVFGALRREGDALEAQHFALDAASGEITDLGRTPVGSGRGHLQGLSAALARPRSGPRPPLAAEPSDSASIEDAIGASDLAVLPIAPAPPARLAAADSIDDILPKGFVVPAAALAPAPSVTRVPLLLAGGSLVVLGIGAAFSYSSVEARSGAHTPAEFAQAERTAADDAATARGLYVAGGVGLACAALIWLLSDSEPDAVLPAP